jgi:P27 family predicted phage terminase small subunit
VAKRGPKAKTAANSRRRSPAAGLWEGFAPPGSFDAATLAEFHRLVGNLRRVGTLGKTDPQLVVAAARTQALLDRAHETLAADGLTVEGGHGSTNPHPLLMAANSLTLRLRGLYRDLGLIAETAKHGDPAQAEAPQSRWAGLLNVVGE